MTTESNIKTSGDDNKSTSEFYYTSEKQLSPVREYQGSSHKKTPEADLRENLIETQVLESFEQNSQIQPEWDDFAESSYCEIFLSYDWCRIWWKYYGLDRDLRVFIFRSEGRIVGIIPLFFEKIRIGPFAVRVAKMVGSDFTISHFSIPIKSDYIKPVLKVFSALMSQQKWDVLYLGPIAGLYKYFSIMTEVLAGCFTACNCRVVQQQDVQTYFFLPNDWESFLSGLKKSERENVRNDYNLINSKLISGQSHQLDAYFAEEGTVDDFFADFVAMHQLHWNKMGKAGHFVDWPHSREFHRELAETSLGLGRLRLLKIGIGDRCFGYQYSYKFGNRYYLFLDARNHAVAQKGIGFGRVNFCEGVKKAINEQIRLMDSMKGIYSHKLRLGGRLFPMKAFYVTRGNVSAAFKTMLLRSTARVINVCYYKIWHRRISPVFSRKYNSLWKRWIRLNAFA